MAALATSGEGKPEEKEPEEKAEEKKPEEATSAGALLAAKPDEEKKPEEKKPEKKKKPKESKAKKQRRVAIVPPTDSSAVIFDADGSAVFILGKDPAGNLMYADAGGNPLTIEIDPETKKTYILYNKK